jgi:hypothetical protein
VEGSSESEQAGRSLLRNLIERGLPVERMRLFVVDGGKGVRAAIRKTFAGWALIQRCQIHKMRNVIDHLPDSKHAWVRTAIRKAWAAGSVEQARKRLVGLAEQLEEAHPSAAASLREGLDETLTILGLRVSATLTRSLRSTNPIENLNSALKHLARRVKRWRGGTMVLRWAVTGILEAEKRFRRIKGYRDLPALSIARTRSALLTQKSLTRRRSLRETTANFAVDFQRKAGHPRDLPCKRLELDKIWGFCYSKQKERPGLSTAASFTTAMSGRSSQSTPTSSLAPRSLSGRGTPARRPTSAGRVHDLILACASFVAWPRPAVPWGHAGRDATRRRSSSWSPSRSRMRGIAITEETRFSCLRPRSSAST